MAKLPRDPYSFVQLQGADGRPFMVPEEVAAEVFSLPPVTGPTSPTGPAPTQPARPDAEPAFGAMPDESQVVGPALDAPAIPEGAAPAEPPAPPAPGPTTPLGMPQAAPGTSESVSIKVQPGVVVPAGGKFQKIDTAPIEQGYDLIGQGIAEGYGKIADAAGRKFLGRMGEIGLERAAAHQISEEQRLEQERRARAQELIAQKSAELEAHIEERRAAVPKTDPKRLFKNFSNFDRAVMLISSAMAGALAARQGHTKNAVIDTVMQLVENDIRAQQTDIETAREDVYRAERAYDRGVARLDRDEMAKRELAIYKIEAIKTKLAADKMQFASVFTQAEYDEMIGQLELKQGEFYKQLLDATADNVMRAVSVNNQAEASRQGLAIDRGRLAQQKVEFAYKQQRDQLADRAAAAKGQAELAGNVIGVSTGFGVGSGGMRQDLLAPDKELADKLRTAGIAAGQVYTALSRLEKQDLTRLKNNPDEYAAVAREMAAALLGYMETTGEKLGRTTERDVQYMKDAAFGGDPSKFMQLLSNEHFRKSLMQSKDDITEKMSRRAKSWGNRDADWQPPVVETDAAPRETSAVGSAKKLSEMQFSSRPAVIPPPGTGPVHVPREGDPMSRVVPGAKLSPEAVAEQGREALALAQTILVDAREKRIAPVEMVGYANTLLDAADEAAKAGLGQEAMQLREAATALRKMAEPELGRRTQERVIDVKR